MTDQPTEPGAPHPLTLDTTDTSDTRCLVIVHGDVDLDTAPRLTEAIDNALSRGRPHIAVDMDAVTFIDSIGLRALLQAHEHALAAEGSLRITAASTVVLRLLDIAGFTEQLLDPGD
jgi:anti-anti-sigma factor